MQRIVTETSNCVHGCLNYFFIYRSDCDNQLNMNKGNYHWRKGGEKHMNDPTTISNLQVCLCALNSVLSVKICEMI